MDSKHGSGSSVFLRTKEISIAENVAHDPLILAADCECVGASSKHTRTDTKTTACKEISEVTLLRALEHESGSRTVLDSENQGMVHLITGESPTHSISSSSSESSSEEFMLPMPISHLVASSGPHGASQLEFEHHKSDTSDETHPESEEPNNESPVATSSQLSDITNVPFFQVLPQSPPVQVMDRSEGYDPTRIAPSTFSSEPSTPMDWSIGSNDSLFSLHIGNNSFSRENVFMLSGQLCKCGELSKSRELKRLEQWQKSGELDRSVELIRSSQPSPVTNEGKTDLDLDKNTDTIGASDQSVRNTQKASFDDKNGQKHPHLEGSRTSTHCSDGSEASGQSFAFPIFAGGGRSSPAEKVSPVWQQHPQPLGQVKKPKTTSSWSWCCFSCFKYSSCSSSCFNYCSCIKCSSCFKYCSYYNCCSCVKFLSCFKSPSFFKYFFNCK